MITKQNVIDSDPILIVYPAGTGGEHIAHTLSVCSDEFEDLQTRFVKKVNQHHTICVLKYSTAFSDIELFESGLDSRYTGNFIANKSRVVLKDHPTEQTHQFYHKHLPNITVLFVTPVEQADYFADLTFKKLAVKVQTPIDRDYVEYEISSSLTSQECNHMIDQANQYPWVWRHELHILTTQMREQKKLVPIEHADTLDKIKNDHLQTLINTYITTAPQYQKTFNNCHIINCDSLRYDSRDFWVQVKDVVPSLNLDRAIEITNTWVEKNNRLGTN